MIRAFFEWLAELFAYLYLAALIIGVFVAFVLIAKAL